MTGISCKQWGSQESGIPIAKVNKNVLYLSDIGGDTTSGASISDWQKEQIDFWVRKQLWLTAAKKEKVDPSIERKVEDYRQSLLVETYKEGLVENANLKITDEMVKAYYEENKAAYTLQENLYKSQFYLVPKDFMDLNVLENLNEEVENEVLKQHCINYPSDCLVDPVWVSVEVLEDLGLPDYLQVANGKYKQYFLDNDIVCIYRITDKINKGNTSPLELVKEEINQVLRFQKKKEFVQNKEEELFINAQNNKSFEIYK